MTFPTEPGRLDAPTSATDRGRKNDFRFRMLNFAPWEREDV